MTVADLTPAGAARTHASRRRKAALPENRYRIESEYVSIHEIAQRIGVTKNIANSRLARLRRASGAITWARLRGESA